MIFEGVFGLLLMLNPTCFCDLKVFKKICKKRLLVSLVKNEISYGFCFVHKDKK
ncbi:hypothetical protein Hanom_Chr07g00639681 [Helianthus anomalus]